MNIFVVDISGRVSNYDIYLCEAINKSLGKDDDLCLICPLYSNNQKFKVERLLNFIPQKLKSTDMKWKRGIKLLEIILNYIIVIFKVAKHKPDIIHFQWFPLLEYFSIEKTLVKWIKIASSKTKLVLTIHNIFPHNFSEKQKQGYKDRFTKLAQYIDKFIVHTTDTKKNIIDMFSLDANKVSVVHHGIFVPKDFTPSKNTIKDNSICFIMYGNMSEYKGVDLFIEAYKSLPEDYQKRAHGIIAGLIPNRELYDRLREESKSLRIDWFPYFLPEQELYEKINDSNVIVLPYRQISQSGVLLLALYFQRLIITSDLPAFKETLEGFNSDYFFESGNAQDLMRLMKEVIDGDINFENQLSAIEKLNVKYSWEKAAKKIINEYYSLL